MTDREKEVLALIGLHGEFDYGLPDDDATVEALQSLFHQGLIKSDPSRVGDFIYPTRSGEAAIRDVRNQSRRA